MMPAEYSAVEFETRLASYSDSERNSGEQDPNDPKKRRRESRDDAWVDILVNSHSRRMVGQEVDPNTLKSSGSGGDPDMASLEVAQVLAAVRRDRQRSPSLGSSSSGGDFMPHSHTRGVDMDAHVQGLEIDEIETVPHRLRGGSVGSGSTGTGHRGLTYERDDEEYAADAEGADEEHDHEIEHSQDHSHSHHPEPVVEPAVQEEEPESLLSVRHALKQQRRLGYFDLHPERKQLYTSKSGDEDDTPQGASPTPDLPSIDSSLERKRVEAEKTGTARADSATLPIPAKSNGSPVNANGNGVGGTAHPIGPRAPAGAVAVGTKTAALIEMYRERERRATAPTAAAAPTTTTSATPAAVAPLPVPSAPAATPAAAPLRPAQRTVSLPAASNVSAGAVVEDVEPALAPVDVSLMGPPRVPFEETGRASPMRYVHGAPLHNVLEEEEEE